MKGLSASLSGTGIVVSIFSNNSYTLGTPKSDPVPFKASKADPITIYASSPLYSYLSNNSLTSISTNS